MANNNFIPSNNGMAMTYDNGGGLDMIRQLQEV